MSLMNNETTERLWLHIEANLGDKIDKTEVNKKLTTIETDLEHLTTKVAELEEKLKNAVFLE